jgi:hypothetical protein
MGMSFDLGVWYSEHPLNDREASEVYLRLCEEWPYLEGENAAVAAFYAALTEHWPELETVPEEKIDDKDYCPWSGPIDHSGMAVLMNCVWSMADKVGAYVADLAYDHGLVIFDPQADRVSLPQHLLPTPERKRDERPSFLSRIFGKRKS